MINYIKYYAFCLSLICTITYSQSDAKIKFNEGIEAYNEGSYENAHELFKKAYELDEDYSKAIYNAGNAAYRNGDFENAKNHYSTYIDNQKDNKLKAEAYHNLGNLYYDKFLKDNKNAKKEMLQQNMGNQEDQIEDLKKSIDYYKNALRANPYDEKTRYNLSSALKHVPPPSEDKQKKNKDQQEKEKEKEKEKKDQQEKDQEEENQQEEENKEKEDQQEEEKEGEISKDQMEKILKDINNEEKKIMKQLMKDSLKTKKGSEKNYKDW